jgi:hypothetical protein
MKNFFTSLFCKQTIDKLESEIVLLKEKLDEKQEVINQTNAYWKRRLYSSKKEFKKKQKL